MWQLLGIVSTKQLTRVEEQLCSEARDFLLQEETAHPEDQDEGNGDSGEDGSTTFAGHSYRLKEHRKPELPLFADDDDEGEFAHIPEFLSFDKESKTMKLGFMTGNYDGSIFPPNDSLTSSRPQSSKSSVGSEIGVKRKSSVAKARDSPAREQVSTKLLMMLSPTGAVRNSNADSDDTSCRLSKEFTSEDAAQTMGPKNVSATRSSARKRCARDDADSEASSLSSKSCSQALGAILSFL